MNSVKHWATLAAPTMTNMLCLLCLAGLWSLMTVPAKPWLRDTLNASAHETKNNARPVLQAGQRQQERQRQHKRQRKERMALRRSIDESAYPIPHWAPPQQLKVEPALIYAIIKQESRFKANARSHAGARGLMQIMPQTAEYMIKRYRLNEIRVASLTPIALPEHISSRNLNDPAVNLLIGQHYIKYLNDKSYIRGNLVYLLAAYNAGPGNLIRWQKKFGHLSPEAFAERIPFTETRRYVQKVLANYRSYYIRLYGREPDMTKIHAQPDQRAL